MEREMAKRIMEFNMKVKEEETKIQEIVKAEVAGIREEIEREENERALADQSMLDAVTNFLSNL